MYQEKKIKSKFRNCAFALLGAVLIATTSLFSGCGLPTRGNQILISPNAIIEKIHKDSVTTPTMQVVEFMNPRKNNAFVYFGQNVNNSEESVLVHATWNPREQYLNRHIRIDTRFQGYPAEVSFDMIKYGSYVFKNGIAYCPEENRRLYEETPGVLETEKQLDGVIQGLETQMPPEFDKVEFIKVPRENMILARLAADTQAGVNVTHAHIGWNKRTGSLGTVTTLTVLKDTDMPPIEISVNARDLGKPLNARMMDRLRTSVFNSEEWQDYYRFKIQNPERDYRDGEKLVFGLFKMRPAQRPTRGVYDNYIRHPAIVKREEALIETAWRYAFVVAGGVQASLDGSPRCAKLVTDFTSPEGKRKLILYYNDSAEQQPQKPMGRGKNKTMGFEK